MNADSQIILAVTLGAFAGSMMTMLACFFPWRQVFCRKTNPVPPVIQVVSSPVQNVSFPDPTREAVV